MYARATSSLAFPLSSYLIEERGEERANTRFSSKYRTPSRGRVTRLYLDTRFEIFINKVSRNRERRRDAALFPPTVITPRAPAANFALCCTCSGTTTLRIAPNTFGGVTIEHEDCRFFSTESTRYSVYRVVLNSNEKNRTAKECDSSHEMSIYVYNGHLYLKELKISRIHLITYI